MKAYWTTDDIVLDPSCSWQTATKTGPVNSTWDVTLSKSNLNVSLGNDDFGMFLLSSNVYSISVSSPINNKTKASVFNNKKYGTVPVDGSVLFVIDQLKLLDYPDSRIAETLPVESVWTYPPSPHLNSPAETFSSAPPHVSIQTRQVWVTGNGNLTLGKRSQGNVDFYQTNYLLSYIFLD